MAQLIIKGHHTRGDEIITTLEMLGGKNTYNLKGDEKFDYYTIDKDDAIRGGLYICNDDESENIVSFTLEIFKDKFPYKVGDKVITTYGIIGIVKQLVWSNKDNAIRYKLKDDEDSLYFANELQPYKEETITIDDFKANTKEWLIDKLESMSKDNALQSICNIYDELHKSKYPKTYEKCCDVLLISPYYNLKYRTYEHGYDEYTTSNELLALQKKLNTLGKLLICRDAYWKIVGEKMGLGKPWRPDFTNNDEERYGIYTAANKVEKDFCGVGDVNTVLTFPIEKMRDTFYENFKDLIEQCKELL